MRLAPSDWERLMADLQARDLDHAGAAAAQARREKVNEVWSAASVRNAGTLGRYWLAHPMVQARVNTLASGRPDVDAYGRLAELLARRGWPLPMDRAISLGCGFGGLERDLVGRGLCRRVHALDLAEGAVAEARRLAEAEGFGDRIRYQVADLESAALPPGSADVVFAHQSVHHIEALDELFLGIRRALRPGGVLHLHEFVGPIRFQWTDAQLALANGFLDSLPSRLRRTPSGVPKGRLARPTIAAMLAIDPTEAIRSAEIPAVLRRHFDVVEERRLGGALAHIALGDVAQNFDPADLEARSALERLFALEDEAMADGRIGSDFVTLTAVPKRWTLGVAFRRFAGRPSVRRPRPPAQAAPDAPVEELPFDEAWYLDAYPDVRDAVAGGVFESGHDHWLRFGKAEGRLPSGGGQPAG
jgi:SAM-dependent methyltransferase